MGVNASQPMRAFGVSLRQKRSALAQHSGVHIFDNLWFIILSHLGCGNTRPSHNILLYKSLLPLSNVHAIVLHI